MYFSDEFIEQVIDENNITDVIGEYVHLEKKGSTYFGLCPFHNEKTPSFSVTPRKRMYYCFGCGKGGSVITFLMQYEGLEFTEAVKVLAKRAGIEIPEDRYQKEDRREKELKTEIRNIYAESTKYYHHLLKTDQGALALRYLKNRGLKEETIIKFGLGYSGKYGDNLYRYLKSKKYSDEILNKTGLFSFDEKKGFKDRFWNRVMFPIADRNNKVIAFGGRVMGEGKPKYLNSPDTPIFNKKEHLYGLNYAKSSKENYILLCEGYMDVISLHQAGFTNAVAALGTAFGERHALLIKKYAGRVVLSFDSDGAGRMAALRAIPILRECGLDVRVLDMSPCKDPDELIKSKGAHEYKRRIEKAENFFMFQVRMEMQNHDMSDPSGRTNFARRLAVMLTSFDDNIERGNYMEQVCSDLGINKDDMKRLVDKCMLRKTGQRIRPAQPEHKSNREKIDAVNVEVIRNLFSCFYENPDWFDKASPYISTEHFTDPFYHDLAVKVWDQMEKKNADAAAIIDSFTDVDEHSKAAFVFVPAFQGELDEGRAQTIINESVKKIRLEFNNSHFANSTDPSDIQKGFEDRREIGNINIVL